MQNDLAVSFRAALAALCVHCKNYREISAHFLSTLYNPQNPVKSPTVTGAIMHQRTQVKDLNSTLLVRVT